MKRRGVLLACLLWLLPTLAHAQYFERTEVGARGIGLAGAAGANTDDVSAVYWNPAALSLLERPEVQFTHGRPYVVTDLAANSVAAGLRLAGGGLAVSWHRLGVDEVVSEDMIGVSFARWIYKDNRRVVHAGASAKLALVSFGADAGSRDFGSASKVTGDLALLWEEQQKVRFGLVWRNVNRPTFDFVGEDGGTKIPGGPEFSVAYRWREEASVMLARSDTGEHAVWSYSGELWFYQVFALRAGVVDSEFAGGVGLKSRTWSTDVSFVTNRDVGNSYTASIHFRIPVSKDGAP